VRTALAGRVTRRPLAHSAPTPDAAPQVYADHVSGVRARAMANATALARYSRDTGALIRIVDDGAQFHDLGKLDADIQAALRRGRGARLAWDHVDAGVAHLLACDAKSSAWLVRAHHSPGLPSRVAQRLRTDLPFLRGRRGNAPPEDHQAQIARTDRFLPAILADHIAAVEGPAPQRQNETHGLTLRLALSCLVDADHADTAFFDTNTESAAGAATRWPERLAALDAHVAGLVDRGGERDRLRRAFYEACRYGGPQAALAACDGPVGIGKTTAVTAFLLRRAIETGARRLFVVAPFTTILSQTAQRLREALVLPGEDPFEIVAEHHHRADFSALALRQLATLWTAPIVLTTAVQFFETLAANEPRHLRKLHQLPGAVVFIDEAHATLPTRLWPQNWRWIRDLAENWSCSFVFASGSLARFWENEDIVGDKTETLPELTPPVLVEPMRRMEAQRIAYETLGRFHSFDGLIETLSSKPGPRLVIMNTVQNAAVVALRLKEKSIEVEHLSTALCPRDRDRALKRILACLDDGARSDWTLVATSLVEAGVEMSFRTAFRERFSTASLIQTGGRVNRHALEENCRIYDFALSDDPDSTGNPAARIPAEVLERLFAKGALSGSFDAADLVTRSMEMELTRYRDRDALDRALVAAEEASDYPAVAQLGKVIDSDTRLVVVDPHLRDRIIRREDVSPRDLLSGSVQLWSKRIANLALEPIGGQGELYWWPHPYDPDFLGYMKGALYLRDVSSGKLLIE
jgi:CRISPR-associated endonuclease/helicase Cas3